MLAVFYVGTSFRTTSQSSWSKGGGAKTIFGRYEKLKLQTENAELKEKLAQLQAQVTEQQVSAEMYAYGNISAALGLPTASGLDYIWWDSLQALAANGEGKEFLVGVNPQVVLPVEEK